jgi:hypothetical protein
MKGKTAAIVLIGVGVVFLAIGIWRGEAQVVFTKAVRICLECIGIG